MVTDNTFLERRVMRVFQDEVDAHKRTCETVIQSIAAADGPPPLLEAIQALANGCNWLLLTTRVRIEDMTIYFDLIDPRMSPSPSIPWLSVELKELDIYPNTVKVTPIDIREYVLSFKLGEEYNADHLSILGHLLTSISKYQDFGHDGRIEQIVGAHGFTLYGGGIRWDIRVLRTIYEGYMASWHDESTP